MSHKLRLAGRVCLALGIDDPEKWLHEAHPRKVAFWQAFFKVEPFGCDWERSALHSAQLSALTATVAATAGAKMKPQDIDAFMPTEWAFAKRNRPVTVDSQSIAKFQSWAQGYGKKNGNNA